MAASRSDIERWISTARQNNNEFIISVCDSFDWEDYPIYCKDREELLRRYPEFDGINMQRINEVIRIPKKKNAIENYNIYDF